jgi:hypothetical protein
MVMQCVLEDIDGDKVAMYALTSHEKVQIQ